MRNEAPGIGVPVAFALLYATWELLAAVSGGVVYPVVERILGTDDKYNIGRLSFTRFGVQFDLSQSFVYGFAFLIFAVVAYVVFVRPIGDEDELDPGMRECPECRSEIVVDATRCRYCTTIVTPVTLDDDEEPETA